MEVRCKNIVLDAEAQKPSFKFRPLSSLNARRYRSPPRKDALLPKKLKENLFQKAKERNLSSQVLQHFHKYSKKTSVEFTSLEPLSSKKPKSKL